MAKPKFELTAALVNVQPEPEEASAQSKNEQIQYAQSKIAEDSRVDANTGSFSSAAIDTFSERPRFVSPGSMQTHRINSSVDQREEERETCY